jgi:hypothetical protein
VPCHLSPGILNIYNYIKNIKTSFPDFKDINALIISTIYVKDRSDSYNPGISWLAENLLASQQ